MEKGEGPYIWPSWSSEASKTGIVVTPLDILDLDGENRALERGSRREFRWGGRRKAVSIKYGLGGRGHVRPKDVHGLPLRLARIRRIVRMHDHDHNPQNLIG